MSYTDKSDYVKVLAAEYQKAMGHRVAYPVINKLLKEYPANIIYASLQALSTIPATKRSYGYLVGICKRKDADRIKAAVSTNTTETRSIVATFKESLNQPRVPLPNPFGVADASAK